MRHGKKYKKLGRDTSHRLAMLDNMVLSLFLHGSIKTTVTKAKAMRICAERLITRVKNADVKGSSLTLTRHLHAAYGNNEKAIKTMLSSGKVFANRNGGYTRVIKLMHRNNDKADMALVEFVEPLVSFVETVK